MTKKFIMSILFLAASTGFSATSFITTWKTTVANETVAIPMLGTYDYDLNDDGTFEVTNQLNTYTATFATAGDHTIRIKPSTGTSIQIQISAEKYGPYNTQLQLVTQWGDYKWTSMDHAFHYAIELDVTATDIPDFSAMTSMEDMFYGCRKLVGNSTFNSWDTSTITTMRRMFSKAEKFNQPIDNWDTSNVTSMYAMFFCWPAEANDDTFPDAFNQDISGWDTSKVTDMGSMFVYNPNFNQPIGSWDTGEVTNMTTMFYGTIAFNQPINSWNIAKVSDMPWMFYDAKAFDQDISTWDIETLTTAEGMLDNSGMSTVNYDKLLIGWNNQVVASLADTDGSIRDIVNVTFGAFGTSFTEGGAAETARENLILNGWGDGVAGGSTAIGDPSGILDTPVTTPVVGMTLVQEIMQLTWTLDQEVGVIRYEIYDLLTNALIKTVEANGSNKYSVTLNSDRKVYLIVVDSWGSQTFMPEDGSKVTTTYDLEKGWNLISIAGNGVDLSTIEQSSQGKIWSWNGSIYVEANNPQVTAGLWVNAKTSTTVFLTGEKSDAKIKLTPGWNMVGPTANSNIPAGALSTFSYKDEVNQVINETEILQTGIGYWIFSL